MKPNIYSRNGVWFCAQRKRSYARSARGVIWQGSTAQGDTPAEAYAGWAHFWDE